MPQRRARTLAARAQKLPGVLEAVGTASGAFRIEFDREVTTEPALRDALTGLGLRLGAATTDRQTTASQTTGDRRRTTGDPGRADTRHGERRATPGTTTQATTTAPPPLPPGTRPIHQRLATNDPPTPTPGTTTARTAGTATAGGGGS